MVHRRPPYFIDRPGTLRAGWRSINQSMEQGWMNQMAQLFNLWEIPAAVLSSFAAHLFLVLFAGIRRRKASGMLMLLLWLAYQLANWVAPYALSNLSLCDPSPRQQLIAFWAPFLLHHLGGPDNISAFSLEDNALSGREALTVFSRIGGASYVLYKHVYIGGGGGGGSLIPASIIVFVIGAAKYVERAFALWQGDLGNIRSSRRKEKQPITSCSDSLITMGCHHLLLDEEALLVAHQMLPFCKRAMSDSSVDADDLDLDRSRKIFTLRWENMCSVVEMELSLMYDILYTKVAVVHTWHGYLIRIVKPLAIAAAIMLFALYNIEDQAIPDVIITYTLLLGTFLLDTRWLLRALGSTWMHAFLKVSRLHRAFFGIGRWHRLRRAFVSLDLGRLRLTAPPRSPGSYRRWSGKVGQYSLLREVTRGISGCGRAVKKIGLEDVWKEYHHSNTCKLSEEVKQAVFTRVTEVLISTYEVANKDGRYSMSDITTSWGRLTAERYKEKHAKGGEEEELHLAFGREFQEDILVWHIGTKVFLMSDAGKLYAETKHAKAIKALSEHLMFLVAVRRHMLPGLMLRSLYERTFESLQRVWSNERDKARSSSCTREEQKLAQILLGDKQGDSDWGLDDVETSIVSDGVNLAIELLRPDESEMPQLLELVFNVWVDKLLHAAVSCSTESHAKQLSRGGDSTTIVWIMAQHAGPFQIGQQGPDYDEKSEDEIEKKLDKTRKKKAEGKKKKEAEEKKKEEKKAGENYPPYCPYPLPSWPPAVDQWMPPAQPVPQPSWPPAVNQWMPPAQPVPQPGGPPKEDVKRPKRRRAKSRRYATLYPVD